MSQSLNTKEHQCEIKILQYVSGTSHYLSKRHDVMFDVRPRNGLGVFAVISDYYSDGWIVSSHAVDKILKLIITQESLCSYGYEGTDVVLCREVRSKNH